MSIWREKHPKGCTLAEGERASQSLSPVRISIVWLELSSSEPGFSASHGRAEVCRARSKEDCKVPMAACTQVSGVRARTQLEIQKERGMTDPNRDLDRPSKRGHGKSPPVCPARM